METCLSLDWYGTLSEHIYKEHKGICIYVITLSSKPIYNYDVEET